MTDLFDKTDVLTVLTLDKVKAGDEGYLGDCLEELNRKIKNGYIQPITSIDQSNYILHPFKNGRTNYALFLPTNKVKNKEPTYRPFNCLDDLFNFLMPDFDADTYDTYGKAELILCGMYELKDKLTGNICYRCFSQIYLSDNYIRLDDCPLDYYFQNYEIKKDGEFVPFGILEE